MSEITRATFAGIELRLADVAERIVEGVVVPWGEISYLTPDPKGERFLRGALTRSIEQRGERIRLFANHTYDRPIGKALEWKPNRLDGCWAAFKVRRGIDADELLDDLAGGLLDAFSVGFRALRERRSDEGVREVLEAELHEVSIVPIGAYDGARVLATRDPQRELRLPDPPAVNLECLPPLRRL